VNNTSLEANKPLGSVCFYGCTVHKEISERFESRVLQGRGKEDIPLNNKYPLPSR